jgi:hypothetical protein
MSVTLNIPDRVRHDSNQYDRDSCLLSLSSSRSSSGRCRREITCKVCWIQASQTPQTLRRRNWDISTPRWPVRYAESFIGAQSPCHADTASVHWWVYIATVGAKLRDHAEHPVHQELHEFEAGMPRLQEERKRGTTPADGGVGGSSRVVESCKVLRSLFQMRAILQLISSAGHLF